MSKVYIEGFEFPKSCRVCKFCDFRSFDKLNYCRILDEAIVVYKGKRQDDCPLREVENDTTREERR